MTREFRIVVKDDLRCPKCGATEMHPDGKHVVIRGFKVEMGDGHWWSQCLRCAGYYNADLSEYDNNAGDSKKGWF